MTAALFTTGILAAVAAIALGMGWLVWQRRQPTGPAPIQHEGANEAYADELRAAKATAPAPELRSSAEQVVIDHQALDGITAAVEAFDNSIDQAIRKILRGDTAAYMQVTRWGQSVLDKTGEMPIVREPVPAGAR